LIFIDEFLKAWRRKNNRIIVIDETGIGTAPLRTYTYCRIGEHARGSFKPLKSNLTVLAAIGINGVEGL